ncbi:hypothetical protein [Calycomorphotria hydatis]|uniref:Uncharacterized protein n=1 Tax=Calycomorphotria hydatis TaxID=2528027 RepID=A0A517TAY9_9PLAN|nr:hypothetical protein [Calycomorphotria hydatis]QDT65538.1 hypothetical protein V22_27930 [Calycomorphotria hydatis]
MAIPKPEFSNWLVQLTADRGDLSLLQRVHQDHDWKVHFDDEEKCYLDSRDFVSLADSKEVSAKAEEFCTRLNTVLKSVFDEDMSCLAAGPYKFNEDGSQTVYLSGAVSVKITALAIGASMKRDDGSVEKWDSKGTHTITNAGGELVLQESKVDRAAKMLDSIERDDVVHKVCRLYSKYELDFVNGYRILELIQNDLGGDWSLIGVQRSQVKQFTHTANSDSAGDIARHGVNRNSQPTRPMSLSDGKRLIESMVKNWLQYRARMPS